MRVFFAFVSLGWFALNVRVVGRCDCMFVFSCCFLCGCVFFLLFTSVCLDWFALNVLVFLFNVIVWIGLI